MIGATRTPLALIAIAGLYGALGVVGSAVAAHAAVGVQLATAAQFLLFHATLLLALVALAQRSDQPRVWLAIAAAVAVGTALFSGDVAKFAITGTHLFPMAAPTGGSILIAGWAAIFCLAVWKLIRGAAG